MDKKSWTQALERQKVMKMKLRCLQPSFRALSQNLQAGLPVTATENQEEAAKLFASHPYLWI